MSDALSSDLTEKTRMETAATWKFFPQPIEFVTCHHIGRVHVAQGRRRSRVVHCDVELKGTLMALHVPLDAPTCGKQLLQENGRLRSTMARLIALRGDTLTQMRIKDMRRLPQHLALLVEKHLTPIIVAGVSR